MWVEINACVNYPIKTVLVQMLENGEFDLDDEMQAFCVSWFAIRVAAVGVQLFVSSWNEHPIPGMCINSIYQTHVLASLPIYVWWKYNTAYFRS